ncbi:MAG: methyltransferase domain-containing protein [Phycisphaerales bacterium]|nr:methyltransferase domain-containing protein [Planctomycetota bacterium]
MPADFTKTYFARAEAWSQRIDRYQQEVLGDLLAILPADCESILDVGCGNGLLTNQLPASIRVVGLDPSPVALESVQREKVCADATRIPFQDGAFDVVMANDVIEHVRKTDEAAIVREMARVARRLVIVTVPFMEDLACASVRCAVCRKLYHINHHRRAYDIGSTKDLPLGGSWRCAARIVTGDNWSRDPAPLPRLRTHLGYDLKQLTSAVCPGCGSTETVPPRTPDRALQDLENRLAQSEFAPSREATELARCRTELMTVFASDIGAEEELWSRLESQSAPRLAGRRVDLGLCEPGATSPGSPPGTPSSSDLPRWPVQPAWVRGSEGTGRMLVSFPAFLEGSLSIRIRGESPHRGTITVNEWIGDYARHDEVEVPPGAFDVVLPPSTFKGCYGRLLEILQTRDVRISSVALEGSGQSREHLPLPETARFIPLDAGEQIWLSVARYEGELPLDAWMTDPAQRLTISAMNRSGTRTAEHIESAREFGSLAAAAVRRRPWRIPVARAARPSGARMHVPRGRAGNFVMICHDQQIDRRILQQSASLIDAGWAGAIVCLSRDDEDALESDGPLAIHRIGLRHIVPDNWLYWGHAVRNWLCHRRPAYGKYAAWLNGKLYPPQLRLAYGGKNINHPLSFDLCFEEAARRYPADIVFAHDLPALRAGASLAKHWGVPLVYDAHELYPEQVTFTLRQKWICKRRESAEIGRADAVFTVNRSIAAEMARRYGIAEPGVLLNAGDPPGSSVSRVGPDPIRSRLGLPPEKKIVLLQGGLSPHRNIEMVAASAEFVRSENAVIVILGSGSIEDQLRSIGEKSRTLGSRLFLIPAVPQEDLIAYSAGADLGIIPYPAVDLNTRFCTPNKLFEYIAAGVPIAANDLPELRRYVKETGFGEVGNTSSPREIAVLIDRMLETPGLLEGCRARIREGGRRYTWDTEALGLIETVETVTQTCRIRPLFAQFPGQGAQP